MTMMNKCCKKKRRERTTLILEALIFRHHHFFPILSAVCACFLLTFAAFSFLCAPPITAANHGAHLPFTHTSSSSLKDEHLVISFQASTRSNFYFGCSDAGVNFTGAEMNTEANRFLLVRTSGGLNQQRTGITDAVVAAYILNATLVVPKLDEESFWKDASNFSEIFDVDWFINRLSDDVKIVKQLPEKAGKVMTTHVPRKCDPSCYRTHILPIYHKKRVQAVELTKFDYRLSNLLDPELQKLRCRVNYHALRFTRPILKMGEKLVERMRMKSKFFIALHLRYEPDMLAFSGCYYGGGEQEIQELGKLRMRWKTLRAKDPERERRKGKCPLNPKEVGLMLRALGFGNEMHIYIASGEIYGGEEALAPLKVLFPNLHTKETLASKEELAEFLVYSSRMAALDFIVSDESDVFVANNNGNMAKILAGRRKYFGHKPTIRPNAKKLHRLFLHRGRGNMTWEEFASRVQLAQVGCMGEASDDQVRQLAAGHQFHENPLECICKHSFNSHHQQIKGHFDYGSEEVSDVVVRR